MQDWDNGEISIRKLNKIIAPLFGTAKLYQIKAQYIF